MTEFPIPTPDSGPSGMAAGPDGAMWFTENGGDKIGRITTGGIITEFPIPAPGYLPLGITVGSDGALWFTEHASGWFTEGGGSVGRITLAGAFTQIATTGDAYGIAAGPDGGVWFTELNFARIGAIRLRKP